MKITALDIDRFGIWQGLSVSSLSDQVNVFYGPNEAGKTTIMQFIRAILYGFGDEKFRYVAQSFPISTKEGIDGKSEKGEKDGKDTKDWKDETAVRPMGGGSLSFQAKTASFTLKREYDPLRRGNEEKFTVFNHDGPFAGDQFAKNFASIIDEATFSNIFAIGLDELQHLGILKDAEAAEVLYRLTMGLDRVSFLETSRSLIAARNSWINPTGKPAQMDQLLEQKAKLQDEIGQAKTKLREYSEILTEHRQIDRITTKIESELKRLRYESRLYETAMLLMEVWDQRASVSREIRLMGDVPVVMPDVLETLDSLKQQIAQQRQTMDRLKKENREITKKLQSLSVSETLWKFTPRLEIVLEQEPFIAEMEEQIRKVKLEAEAIKKQFTNQDKGGTNQEKGKLTGDSGATNAQQLVDYRIPAKALRVARQRHKKTKVECQEFAEKSKIFSDRVSAEFSNRKIENIADAMEKTNELVGHLRRRQTIQQRFDEMVLYRKELDRLNAHLVQNQTLPPLVLAGIGVVFVISAVLIVLASMQKIEMPYIVFGILGAVGAFVAKMTIERKNAKKLETNQRQIAMLNGQMEHAKQEAAAIDARYPAQGKSIEMRFQAAQLELAALEKLIPLDAQRKDIRQQSAMLNERRKKSKHSLKFATKRWSDWLETAGLNADTQPGQIRDLLDQANTLGNIRHQYNMKKDELAMRHRELDMLTGQLSRVATAAEIVLPENASPGALMQHIRKTITDNNDQIELHRQLRKTFRRNRRLRKQEKGTLKELSAQKSDIFSRYGVERTEEIRELVSEYQKFLECTQKLENLQREIDAGIAGFCPDEEIGAVLEPGRRENLPALLEQANDRAGLLSLELHEELEKKGQLTQQLNDLGNDRSVCEKQLELAMLNEQIRHNNDIWKRQAFASHVLDMIRLEYEKQRQPETLNEASEYFANMTDGRYRRIWTPIGEETLYVDDFAGNSMDVTWLSRGTREQLFVAIRLALVTSFERDGTLLPLILDDVFVNYDTKRSYSTAKTFLDFASQGRQIFLFTCHEHICRMFLNLGIPVHVLPAFSSRHKKIRTFYPVREEVIPEKHVPEKHPEPMISEPAVMEEEVTEEEMTEKEPEKPEEVVMETLTKPKRARNSRKKRKRKSLPKQEPLKQESPMIPEPSVTVTEQVKLTEPTEPDDDCSEEQTIQQLHDRAVFDVDFFDERDHGEESAVVTESTGTADQDMSETAEQSFETEINLEPDSDDFFIRGFFDEEIDEEELGGEISDH